MKKSKNLREIIVRDPVKYKRLICLILIVFNTSKCSNGIEKDLTDCWDVKNCISLQTDIGIASKELLQELKQHQENLNKIKGENIYSNDSLLFLPKKISNQLFSADTIRFYKTYKYEVVEDTELTIKYPGDELADTALENRIVGKTFINLIGIDASSLDVKLGNGIKETTSNYRLCKLSATKMALVLLDQNVLIFLEKCKKDF
ncbi:MAG: hypothetical protein ACOVOQ_03430 [Flavobacterium sp.]